MGQSIEPKRHHYIPQFILRNFNDKNSQISFLLILSNDNASVVIFLVCSQN